MDAIYVRVAKGEFVNLLRAHKVEIYRDPDGTASGGYVTHDFTEGHLRSRTTIDRSYAPEVARVLKTLVPEAPDHG